MFRMGKLVKNNAIALYIIANLKHYRGTLWWRETEGTIYCTVVKPSLFSSPPVCLFVCIYVRMLGITKDSAAVEMTGLFFMVHACNLPWISDEVWMAPDSRPNDGFIYIIVMRSVTRWEALNMFLSSETGELDVCHSFVCYIVRLALLVDLSMSHAFSTYPANRGSR
jgi:hypothetical protein